MARVRRSRVRIVKNELGVSATQQELGGWRVTFTMEWTGKLWGGGLNPPTPSVNSNPEKEQKIDEVIAEFKCHYDLVWVSILGYNNVMHEYIGLIQNDLQSMIESSVSLQTCKEQT